MLGTVAQDSIRMLTFRRPTSNIATQWKAYLAFGLAFSWFAGIGRYWDNPRAETWQSLGLGSVIYVFVLAGILWLVIAPLRPQSWSYRNVLVFVSLTSPPALLYAIPVEQFMELETAQSANAWFLAVVALWRVSLLAWFLRISARLHPAVIVVATLLPLVLIVVSLAALNLEHVVFEIMAGVDPADRTGNDLAYIVVTTVAVLSTVLAPVLLLTYGWILYQVRRGA